MRLLAGAAILLPYAGSGRIMERSLRRAFSAASPCATGASVVSGSACTVPVPGSVTVANAFGLAAMQCRLPRQQRRQAGDCRIEAGTAGDRPRMAGAVPADQRDEVDVGERLASG